MNAIQATQASSASSPSKLYTNGTIRSVPPEPQQFDTTSDDDKRDDNKKDIMSPSFRSESYHRASITSSNLPVLNGISRGIPRKLSTEVSPSTSSTPSTAYMNINMSENGLSIPSDESKVPATNGIAQWNSAVGRASLGGKSGRVIERLMCENDMLKRDLHIEQLRAEEQKQAVKMTEGKMETLTVEYEGKLHDAAVNKTLLKRRERQLAELRLQIEAEKRKACLATESEKIWKDQIERIEEETKQKVEDALNYAAMMDGRNNAMTSHWKDQGLELNRTVKKLSKEIEEIILERKHDDERLNTLQGLCDQQATQLAQMVDERNAIAHKHEEYKRLQEESLQGIKAAAREQEEKYDRLMAETLKVLSDLKWALGVQKSDRNP